MNATRADGAPRYRLGVDIGGTFTDMVLAGSTGEVTLVKELTRSRDLAHGTVALAAEFLAEQGLDGTCITEIVHGTTLGSNVVLERKGWPTALLTTAGFKDLLVIQRQRRPDLYDLFVSKPTPLVPRSRVFELPERIRADGSVLRPIDGDAVIEIARELRRQGVRSAAVCLLHSYANPAHEQEVAEILSREAPEVFVSLSHDISQRFREYERASTAVINAYVAGQVRQYLVGLRDGFRSLGATGPLYIMQSNGGVALADAIFDQPIRILESGPAAGALMAAQTGAACREPSVISFDMGGTTAKFGLIEDGKVELTDEFEVNGVTLEPGSGLPVDVPTVDLVEIGAGGGSIASVRDGAIAVGPESAGSEPGPACYGRGGTRPTVSDANLILGYLGADGFLGGRMRLDPDAARAAVAEHIAGPLGLSVEEAAWGIHELAIEGMVAAARVVSVDRGHDPRDFAMVAFGGAGPAHAPRMAQRLGVPVVVVPRGAGVASAVGLLSSDIRFEVSRTAVSPLTTAAADAINAVLAELEQKLESLASHSKVDVSDLVFTRTAELRYAGQGYELKVPVPGRRVDKNVVRQITDAFHTQYRQTYGYSEPWRSLEVIAWRLSAVAPRQALTFSALEGGLPPQPVGIRAVYFPETGFTKCAVYERASLIAGRSLRGPLIIEERECTSVLPPDWEVSVDDRGNLRFHLATSPSVASARSPCGAEAVSAR